MTTKPLNRKTYGSIPHLLGSNNHDGDKFITPGQTRICTERVRDRLDVVIVQEKHDGCCSGVTRIDGSLVALSRSGYRAVDSPHKHLKAFDRFVEEWCDAFDFIREGEVLVGEWLWKVHSTRYTIKRPLDWFRPFDIFVDRKRLRFVDFMSRIQDSSPMLRLPNLLHMGEAISTRKAMERTRLTSDGIDQPEGVVYRIERGGEVDFLAKYVREGFVPGVHMHEDVRNCLTD